MKLPGPDHPITITSNPDRVRVSRDQTVVAETAQALTLKEANYPPVQYIPRADADRTLLTRSDHVSYCPYKGNASYFHIRIGDRVIENAIWSYEEPYDAVKAIAGRLAFYPDKVMIEQVSA